MITLGPSLTGLGGTQVTGSIIYTLVARGTNAMGPGRHTHVTIISVSIGTSCYHGFLDLGVSISAILWSFYLEIKIDIDPIHMNHTSITIRLDNK
jgi:hypothetical protein